MPDRNAKEFRKIAKSIERAYKDVGQRVPSGLRIIGEEIMSDVKASGPGKGVPIDTGVLRASGRVDGPKMVKGQPVVTLSFGGAAAPYALIQHEGLHFRHRLGEARYLVRGVQRYKPGQAVRHIRINVEEGLKTAARKSRTA